jgi:RimJ/RimL family protein N-acetyltransferase
MPVETMAYQTERLRVEPWHQDGAGRRPDVELAGVVAELLDDEATRWLPPGWQGPYDRERAAAWIAERDAESTVLLASDSHAGRAVGLVLIHVQPDGAGAPATARIGYLLARAARGRGLGGELLGGLVARCRADPTLHALTAGVAPDNIPSVRLLERHGFVLDDEERGGGELTYRLEVA